jgi:hypothetical protein
MNPIRDPETMTADERRIEVASILAAGLLRRVRHLKTSNPDGPQTFPLGPQIGLDLPGETRLSVAQRPAGYPINTIKVRPFSTSRRTAPLCSQRDSGPSQPCPHEFRCFDNSGGRDGQCCDH